MQAHFKGKKINVEWYKKTKTMATHVYLLSQWHESFDQKQQIWKKNLKPNF